MSDGLRRFLLGLMLLLLTGLGQASDFLDPDEAFRFAAQRVKTNADEFIEVRFRIAPGYYLYRDQFKFAVDAPARMGAPEFPPAKTKFDANFGKEVAYYRDAVLIRLPVISAEGPVQLTLVSQGCADAGLCYSPQEARVSLTSGGGGFSDDSAHLAATLLSGNLGAVVLLFFGLGLLLSFTPCVLPMVPILSSLIVGHGANHAPSRLRGFWLAWAYTLGMALVYTAMGIAAGLAGEGLAASLQTPWVLGTSAILMVLFALSMFDVYTLQMPRGIQNFLSQRFGHLRGGRFAGVFAMGALSALIVGPCMAAPLAGALVYISQTRDTVLGGTALFALALGMGMPLLLIGASAGALLPRAGRWMESVKRFFGVLLLATAIWLVAPVLPLAAQFLAWAGLLIFCAVLLGVFRRWTGASARTLATRLLALACLGAGAVWGVGAVTGATDLLAPLAGLQGQQLAPREERVDPAGAVAMPVFERVRTTAELDQLLAKSDKPVMLDFYADWCVSCKEMERFTYTDPRVAAQFAQMRLLQVDVTANNADDRALLKRFQLFGPPGILFFEPGGKPVPAATVIGFQNAERFLMNLQRVPR